MVLLKDFRFSFYFTVDFLLESIWEKLKGFSFLLTYDLQYMFLSMDDFTFGLLSTFTTNLNSCSYLSFAKSIVALQPSLIEHDVIE